MIRSEQINELATALAKAQAAMQAAEFDRTNPHFKSRYASLAAIWDAIRQPLADNGLALIQAPTYDDGFVCVETLLTHTSGQWVSNTLSLPVGDRATAQSIGSALTYDRRYSLALVGVTADEDDDGNAATQNRQAVQPAPGSQRPPEGQEYQTTDEKPAAKPAPSIATSPAVRITQHVRADAATNECDPADFNEDERKRARIALAKLLPGDDNSANRQAVRTAFFGKIDYADFTPGECLALKRFCDIKKQTNPDDPEHPDWIPSAQALQKVKLILAEIMPQDQPQEVAP